MKKEKHYRVISGMSYDVVIIAMYKEINDLYLHGKTEKYLEFLERMSLRELVLYWGFVYRIDYELATKMEHFYRSRTTIKDIFKLKLKQ